MSSQLYRFSVEKLIIVAGIFKIPLPIPEHSCSKYWIMNHCKAKCMLALLDIKSRGMRTEAQMGLGILGTSILVTIMLPST